MSQKIQILVTHRQHAFLRDESERTGISMAELIRRAVDTVYRPETRPRLRGLDFNIGIWRDPDTAGVGRRVPPPSRVDRIRPGRPRR
ncbi:MAG: hypothetical protein QOE36_242 [Gaiellaceae bacterium]|jgi:hypothetical protein|nr:hypothetical protein [Gaiellaceae bacterium]